MFNKKILSMDNNLFKKLTESIIFEEIIDGRKGAILVDKKDDLFPLVRSTTIYNKPAQLFSKIHYDILEKIKNATNLDFNNALIEIYDSKYCTMRYHSDQSLDLVDNSYICLFSCYEKENKDYRTLRVKEKNQGNIENITLDNNSIVYFDTNTNIKYLHKIILEKNTINNKWIGITFRLAKTYIIFINESPYFSHNNSQLFFANVEQQKEYYKLRSLENLSTNYNYNDINYTISISDIMKPI
jgi:hypothetical protein